MELKCDCNKGQLGLTEDSKASSDAKRRCWLVERHTIYDVLRLTILDRRMCCGSDFDSKQR